MRNFLVLLLLSSLSANPLLPISSGNDTSAIKKVEWSARLLAPYFGQIISSFLANAFNQNAWTVQDYLQERILATLKKPNQENSYSIEQEEVFNKSLQIGACIVAASLSEAINQFFSQKMSADVELGVTADLFKRIIHQDLEYFSENSSGELLSKVSKLSQAFSSLIEESGGCLGCCVNLTTNLVREKENRLVLVSYILFSLFLSVLEELFSKNHNWVADPATAISDTLTNLKTVQMFNGYSEEVRFLANALEEQRKEKYSWRNRLAAKIGLQLSAFAFFQAFRWHTGFKKLATKNGCFNLLEFTKANFPIVQSLFRLPQSTMKVRRSLKTIAEEITVLMKEPKIFNKDNAAELKSVSGRILFDNVSFKYKTTNAGFSYPGRLQIEPGQKIALVGKSGSGKTTFVNLLLRFFDVDKGSIFIGENSQDIRDVTLLSLRNAVSVVSQDQHSFGRTIMNNIRYGKPDATDEEVIEAAKKAHIHEVVMALPNGYQSKIGGTDGVTFSGGQMQRISIARAILKNSPILILDEATSALDYDTERKIQESLQELTKNRTTIIIAHRLSTIADVDKVLVFDKGKIVEEGTWKELVDKAGYFYNLLSAQQSLPEGSCF